MRAWDMLRTRLRSLVFSGKRESELREELQLHLERETERQVATGMPHDEARLQARRLFGGVEQIKEASRDARGTAVLEALARDTRYALRRLVHDWRFTAAAVLILGLAIGANTAIFSVVNAVLFREQTVTAPDRLVNIYQNDTAGRPLVVTNDAAYRDMAAYTDIFAATTAVTIPVPSQYLHDGAIRSLTVEYATASYPEVLGIRLTLGRWFQESEQQRGAPLVGVLGHQLWARTFRADPSVVGQAIRVEGKPVTIVGVAPASHRGTIDVGLGTDLWLPLTAMATTMDSPATRGPAIFAPMLVKARLHDGVTVAQARAAMDVLGRRFAEEHPEQFNVPGEFALGPGLTVMPSTDVRVHPQADVLVKTLASVVLVIVSLVLAIACSNLATLLLVRGAARAKEVSVRLAMGAKRGQLVRTLLTESVVLSLLGGAAGCVLAWWALQALRQVELPFSVDLTLDYRVLAFAMLLSLLTGVTFGLAPALTATRVDLLATLRDEGIPPLDQRRLTLKNALIVVQVAVSVLLLGGTSIFLQHAAAARSHRAGYAVDGVGILQTDVRFAGYSETEARNVHEELQRRIEAIPGVESVALKRGGPMAPSSVSIVVDTATGAPASAVEAVEIDSGPGFFETLRIPLLYGRVFDTRDRAETPRVAVVTERLARLHFGTVNAVGRRFQRAFEPHSWIEVVGVVRDTGTGNFNDDVLDPIAPPFFTSYLQSGAPPTTILARSSGDAASLVAAMQSQVRAVDITLPVIGARTMAQNFAGAHTAPNAVATLLAGLAGLGLVLASIGLYAVVSFAVARRTREIGIRMALGARSQQVVWSIARGVAGLVGVGTTVGLILAVLVMLALRGSSGDTAIGNIAVYHPEIDPVALLAIAAVTAVVGVVAAFVPGRRAARLNPLVALRHD